VISVLDTTDVRLYTTGVNTNTGGASDERGTDTAYPTPKDIRVLVGRLPGDTAYNEWQTNVLLEMQHLQPRNPRLNFVHSVCLTQTKAVTAFFLSRAAKPQTKRRLCNEVERQGNQVRTNLG
jgi:hypothetical protein